MNYNVEIDVELRQWIIMDTTEVFYFFWWYYIFLYHKIIETD